MVALAPRRSSPDSQVCGPKDGRVPAPLLRREGTHRKRLLVPRARRGGDARRIGEEAPLIFGRRDCQKGAQGGGAEHERDAQQEPPLDDIDALVSGRASPKEDIVFARVDARHQSILSDHLTRANAEYPCRWVACVRIW